MGALDNILQHKPMSVWQSAVRDEGIRCPDCDAQCIITAPAHDSENMLRVHCENCGHLHFEFKPSGELVPFPETGSACQ